MQLPVFNFFKKRRQSYDLAQSQQYTEVWGGYNHNLRIGENEWYEEANMSAEEYPVLRTRQDREEIDQLINPGGLLAKDAMAVVNNGTLEFNELVVSGLTLDAGVKQLVSMGAYLIIWPDKKYLNTQNLADYGSLGNTVTIPDSSTVSVTLCKQDGTEYSGYTVSSTEPETPDNGDLWMDTSNAEVPVLKEYSGTSAMWVTIPTTYVKLSATGIGSGFEQYDGVDISGFDPEGSLDFLNGSHVIYAVDPEAAYIVVVGIITSASALTNSGATISRNIPDMDFICECGNRLWGCKYGLVDGKPVNELYASKLGDPKNWKCYMGLSTDSWSATRGSDGVFTGAITFQDHPCFFKETCIEKVYPSSTGAHQVVTVDCRGVQKGSWRSLVIVDEVLYYKSIKDVCAFTGSLPQSVSGALGDAAYYDARAGAVDGVLYISMKDSSNVWHLFTCDTKKGDIWHLEDNTKAMMFAEMDGSLYYIDEDTGKQMRCCAGKTGDIDWSVTSGVLGLSEAENRYVSRYVIRLETEGEVRLECRYDNGPWDFKGVTVHSGLGSIVIPVMPQRCDHMQFRLTGTKACRIYSIAKYVQQGSDVNW